MLTKEKIAEITKEFGRKEGDTGSVEVQVALLTNQINALTEHMKVNKKDYSSNRGLLKMVGRRKNMLEYIEKNGISLTELVTDGEQKGLGIKDYAIMGKNTEIINELKNRIS